MASRALLNYPLEITGKTVRILATHVGDARTRLAVARCEFSNLRHLTLPRDCEEERERIYAEFRKRDRNESGRMLNATAAKIADWIYSLHAYLQVIDHDLADDARHRSLLNKGEELDVRLTE
jgi:hypothetical protein